MTAANDPEDFLNRVATKYTWPDGSPATDYPDRFKKNVRLFRYFHVFVFTAKITKADLFAGRLAMCMHAPAHTLSHYNTRMHVHSDSRWTWVPTSHALGAQGDIISLWGNCSHMNSLPGTCECRFQSHPQCTTHCVMVRRYDKERCARMKQWAGGEELRYPDLPILPGIGPVPYHAVCNFNARAPHLWPPEDLRRFLQARHLNAVSYTHLTLPTTPYV